MEQGFSGLERVNSHGPLQWFRIGQGPPSTGLDLDARQTSFTLPGTTRGQCSRRCSGSWLPRKGCQFHGPELPVCCYTFYLCDLNSLRLNTLGYTLGRVNRSGLGSLEVTQSRDKRPRHLPGGRGTTPGRELLVSCSASHVFLGVSCALLVRRGCCASSITSHSQKGVGEGGQTQQQSSALFPGA